VVGLCRLALGRNLQGLRTIGNLAASAVARLLYTVATPTVAFTYLAGWMLVALAMIGWVATPDRGGYAG
jgi:hypothetical protein